MDPGAAAEAALVRVLDLGPFLDLEGEMLDPDLLVAVLTAIGSSESRPLLAETEVDDLFGATVARVACLLLEAERAEHIE